MAVQPTPSYEDITLIDCNRLNSEEVKAGNTSSKAQFTCKTGTGFKLNAGDKVSVHSGFISDRGCGGDVIEFNGRDLNKSLNLSYIKKNRAQPTATQWDQANDFPFGNYPPDNSLLTYYSSEITATEPLKDNSVTTGISYYKTSNGEGYFHLPRRYDALKKPFWYSGISDNHGQLSTDLGGWVKLIEGKQYSSANQWQQPFIETGAAWSVAGLPAQWCDNYVNGRTIDKSMLYLASPTITQTEISFWRGRVCYADTYRYQSGVFGPSSPATQKHDSSYNVQHWDYDTLDYAAVSPAREYKKAEFISNLWKQKNDNSRYTIFKKETNYHTYYNQATILVPDITKLAPDVDNGSVSRADYNQGLYVNGDAYGSPSGIYKQHPRDPSYSEYLLFTEPQTLSVPSGYDSPSNVADDLTNQLNSTSEVKNVVDAVGGLLPRYSTASNPFPSFADNGDPRNSVRQTESAYLNGETYKAMECATSVSFQMENWGTFIRDNIEFNTSATQADPTGDYPAPIHFVKPMTDYLSSYETIGVKRPELFIKGRNFAKAVGGVWEHDGVADKHGVYTLKATNVVGATTDTSLIGKKTNFPWRNIISPCISDEKDLVYSDVEDIKTNIPWTENNLLLLKELFEAQGKYPELFENVEKYSNMIYESPIAEYADGGISPDYTRFLHINPYHTSYAYEYDSVEKEYGIADFLMFSKLYRNTLGSDNLDAEWTTMNGDADLNSTMKRGTNIPPPSDFGGTDATDVGVNDFCTDFSSFPLWIYFDKSRKDIASGGTGDDNSLYYGFAKRHVCEMNTGGLANPNGVNDKYYAISFTTEKIGGTADGLYVNKNTTDFYIEVGRPIGWDCHFNAYGTDAICMYAGYMDQEPKPSGSGGTGRKYQASTIKEDGSATDWWMFQNWSRYYVGANNPQINFDDKSSRFSFNSFHTPEQIGNQSESGSSNTYPVIDDASDVVYKVNKQLLGTNYCPDMIPYQYGAGKKVGDGASDGKLQESIINTNMMPFTIMDAHSGIFIEDFGVPEDKWEESLWGIMGFTYDQFHSALTLSRQTRINNVVTTDDIGKITTNANIVPSTLNEWVTNDLGVPMYTQQMPKCWATNVSIGLAKELTRVDYQPISIDQTSASINAEKLPRKMLRPYFLIKSNVVGDVNYLGGEDGGVALPIVYVVNKENAFGDYFFQSQSQTEFTITQERVLTEITTSIHNPDMSLADLSNDSAIIYKITKMNGAQLNVAQQVLNKKK